MKKIWLGGSAYQLTDEQHAQMEAHLKSELIPPHGTGTQAVMFSEEIALEWINENDLKPVGTQPTEGAAATRKAAHMYKGKGKRGGVVSTILLIAGIVGTLIEQLLDSPGAELVFSQILVTAITTGVGVNSVTPNQAQVEQDILIGDIDTAMPLQGLKVNVDGNTTMDVQGSQPLISTLAKLSQFVAGSGPVIGLLIKIATGRVFCKAAQITMTNNGATTPTVYWNSQKNVNGNGRLIEAKTFTINANTPQTVQSNDFAYLAITNPANVTSFDVTFADGLQQNMSVVEADGLFAKTNETEANGRLDALVTCFDNTRKTLASVKINVGATAVTVMTVK